MTYNKYKNKRCEIDGIKFQSLAEGNYYSMLKLLVSSNEIHYFLRQVPFDLPGGIKYRVDFQVFRTDGTIQYIDVKGKSTALFIMKKKMVEDLYPVKIVCMKKTGIFRFKEV